LVMKVVESFRLISRLDSFRLVSPVGDESCGFFPVGSPVGDESCGFFPVGKSGW
jgi:hypothetical protein